MKTSGFVMAVAAAVLAGTVWGFYKKKKKNHELQEAAKKELLDHMNMFYDCFQPLYQAVSENQPELAALLLKMWKERMESFHELSVYFDTVCKNSDDARNKGEAWLKSMKEWGIGHDIPGELFVITAEHQKRYIFNDIYKVGDKAKVLRPAWWIEGPEKKCIQTGSAAIQ